MTTKQYKICHITTVHPVYDGRIFYKECCSIAKNGYETYLIATSPEDEKISGVNIRSIKKESGLKGRLYSTLHNAYKKAIEIDADLYHLHDPELLLIALWLKKKGKKVVFDSHEFVGEQILTKKYIPIKMRKLTSVLYRMIEAYVCKRIDGVIEVCTIDGKDYFEKRCKRREFITNAPIISKYIDDNSPDPRDMRRICHIGSLTYDRGISYLAEAVSLLQCKLVLAGQFESDNFKDEIFRICGNKLDYKGVVPLSEIQTLLQKCGIGVCTLLDKGQYKHIDILPSKIYDYMLAGLPVIMSNFPYLRKFNEKYKIGLCVNPENPTEIAAAIEYLFSHSKESAQMGINGRNLVLKELNWSVQEDRLLDFYATVINGDGE